MLVLFLKESHTNTQEIHLEQTKSKDLLLELGLMPKQSIST